MARQSNKPTSARNYSTDADSQQLPDDWEVLGERESAQAFQKFCDENKQLEMAVIMMNGAESESEIATARELARGFSSRGGGEGEAE